MKNFKCWPKFNPRSLNYPEIPIFQILRSTAAKPPSRIAIIFDSLEITYSELLMLCERFANATAARTPPSTESSRRPKRARRSESSRRTAESSSAPIAWATRYLRGMAIFLSCLVVGGLIAYIVKRTIKMASLDWIDRTLGGIFGFVRGWAICSIIVLALIAFPARETSLAHSRLGPYVLAGARGALFLVPRDMKDKSYEGYKKILQALNQSGDRS